MTCGPHLHSFDSKATEKWQPGSEWDRNKKEHTLSKAVARWPTPTQRDHKDGSAESCKNVPVNCLLGRAVYMWPTPRQQDSYERRNWKTIKKINEQGGDLTLPRKVKYQEKGGQLNPDWEEWLMGWPIGWTSLEPITELVWLDWSVDPADNGSIFRVTTSKRHRVNRLKAIGNGQVPQCVAMAWECLANK